MKKFILLIFLILCPICFLTGCSVYGDTKTNYIEKDTGKDLDCYDFECVNSFTIYHGYRSFILKHKYTNILYMYTCDTGLSVLYDINGLPLVVDSGV